MTPSISELIQEELKQQELARIEKERQERIKQEKLRTERERKQEELRIKQEKYRIEQEKIRQIKLEKEWKEKERFRLIERENRQWTEPSFIRVVNDLKEIEVNFLSKIEKHKLLHSPINEIHNLGETCAILVWGEHFKLNEDGQIEPERGRLRWTRDEENDLNVDCSCIQVSANLKNGKLIIEGEETKVLSYKKPIIFSSISNEIDISLKQAFLRPKRINSITSKNVFSIHASTPPSTPYDSSSSNNMECCNQ
jgi:hypothetical protein